jgi:hypothetical protein
VVGSAPCFNDVNGVLSGASGLGRSVGCWRQGIGRITVLVRAVFCGLTDLALGLALELVLFLALFGQFFLTLFVSVIGSSQGVCAFRLMGTLYQFATSRLHFNPAFLHQLAPELPPSSAIHRTEPR